MSLPPKKKVCKKGTSKAKGFKGCNEFKYIHRYGLCSSCFGEWIYSSGEGKKLLNGALNKAQKPRKEMEQAIVAYNKEKGLPALLVNVRTVCHTYIKLRDNGKPCISCGTPWNKDFQAGHYFKAETFSTIKYNELNISGQCQLCNLRKDGNFGDYSLRLPKRIGQEKFNEITQLAEIDKKINHKWDREKLKEIRKYYQTKIKEL